MNAVRTHSTQTIIAGTWSDVSEVGAFFNTHQFLSASGGWQDRFGPYLGNIVRDTVEDAEEIKSQKLKPDMWIGFCGFQVTLYSSTPKHTEAWILYLSQYKKELPKFLLEVLDEAHRIQQLIGYIDRFCYNL